MAMAAAARRSRAAWLGENAMGAVKPVVLLFDVSDIGARLYEVRYQWI